MRKNPKVTILENSTIYRGGLMNFSILALALAITLTGPLSAAVQEIKTLGQYNRLFKGTKPMITMYSGAHCGPCKMMKPLFKNVAVNHPDIEFCIIDTGNPGLKKIAREWNIRGLPTVICTHKGEKLMFESGGMETQEIETLVTQFRDKMKKPEEPKKEPKKAEKDSRIKKKSVSKSKEPVKKTEPKAAKEVEKKKATCP